MRRGYGAYKKAQKKRRKKLVEIVRKDQEWDWEYLHRLIVQKLKNMLDYYDRGDNVWQDGLSRVKKIRQIKHALDLENKVYNAEFEDIARLGVGEYERRAMKKFYNYLGNHIQGWWD